MEDKRIYKKIENTNDEQLIRHRTEILERENLIDIDSQEFGVLMSIYQRALNNVDELLNEIKDEYEKIYNHSIINHTVSRIKSTKSVINKMEKKKIELTYPNMVKNINDVAGVRVVCPMKSDVQVISKIIEKIPSWNVIRYKDYIKKPKKSGYSGIHIIVEVPVSIEKNLKEINEKRPIEESELAITSITKKIIYVKVEIQIRTMAMDFWSTNEHKLKYKSNKKISYWNSKKLSLYAKILNALDDGFMKVQKKYTWLEKV